MPAFASEESQSQVVIEAGILNIKQARAYNQVVS